MNHKQGHPNTSHLNRKANYMENIALQQPNTSLVCYTRSTNKGVIPRLHVGFTSIWTRLCCLNVECVSVVNAATAVQYVVIH